MDPRTSVMAFFVGGPLDATSEPVSLVDGRPPWERRCADTPAPIRPK